jgi:hypothetical protein
MPLCRASGSGNRRGQSRAGRTALPRVGITNSVWFAVLLGTASEAGLFLLPCLAFSDVLRKLSVAIDASC